MVFKLWFGEFEGEWEEFMFGKVVIFINGRVYKKEELLVKGKYRVLRVGNFFINKEWYYLNLEFDVDKYCDNGDFLYVWLVLFGL